MIKADLSQDNIDELLLNYKTESKLLNCYHPNLTRENAEKLIMNHYIKNQIDGYFLIRSRSNYPNEFSLSVVCNNTCDHYKIIDKSINAGGFYSIKDDPPVFGLDRLIKTYQLDKKSLCCVLSEEFLPGELIPARIKFSGSKNLLHETVAEVREIQKLKLILNSQYCPDINERDEEGRTALDIACEYDNVEAIKELMKKNASTNSRAIDGFTPLHRAAECNAMHSIDYLLSNTDANPTENLFEDLSVPLHTAAANNNFMCVKMLLKHNVADKPRTNMGKTPLDIAKENNYNETIEVFMKHKPHKAKTKRQDWLHESNVTREKAQIILSNALQEYHESVFLVRCKADNNNLFILSLMSSSHELFNYPITLKEIDNEKCYFIDDGPLFNHLELLIDYHMRYEDGLPIKLLHPIGPNSKYTGNNTISKSTDRSSLTSVRDETEKTKIRKKQVFPQLPRINFHTRNNSTQLESIKLNLIKFNEKIGEGEFGSVYKGVFKGSRPVAIKILNDFNSSKEFLQEVDIMKKLGNHPCIIRIFGTIIEKDKFMMVQELMLCSLLDKLYELPRKITEYNLKKWAIEIVSGMQHMESKKIVHRDLAARNILLDANLQAKIADFGLSRKYENEYTQTSESKIPIKWYSPESIERCRFTSKSDVWSYGVTLWEMWSYGDIPYGQMNGAQVYQFIKSGRRLSQPNECSASTYGVMRKCWEWDEERRPAFMDLKDIFKTLSDDETSDYNNVNGIYL